MGMRGNDSIDGGAGLDTVVYGDDLSLHTITNTSSGFVVSGGVFGSDILTNVERLKFSDTNIAYDINGNAGITAKILGAVFGIQSILNKVYTGIGIDLLDGGMTYEDLVTLAINAAGAISPEQVVNLLWTNVVGSAPSTEQAQPFLDMLNTGMTVGQLGVLAADTDINQNNINIAGLATTGIEFI
jgi:hypothetical protein